MHTTGQIPFLETKSSPAQPSHIIQKISFSSFCLALQFIFIPNIVFRNPDSFCPDISLYFKLSLMFSSFPALCIRMGLQNKEMSDHQQRFWFQLGFDISMHYALSPLETCGYNDRPK